MIYADLMFLLNFAMDGALLLATAWTRKLKVKVWRLAASAAFGALYVMAALFPELMGLFNFATKMLVSMLMVLIAFGFGGMRQYMRTLAAFYLLAFSIAGGILGLYYYFMPSEELLNEAASQLYGWSIGYGWIAAGLIVMILLFLRVFHGVKQKEALVRHMASVEIRVAGTELRCEGLVDTGNQLYDPLTKTPVMITEASLWKDVLPEAWLKRLATTDADRIVTTMGEDGFPWQDRLRIVPYRGVNRSTQFMLAVKPDSVRVLTSDREWLTAKVLVGFDGGTLSSDGSYRAIIHPMLLQD